MRKHAFIIILLILLLCLSACGQDKTESDADIKPEPEITVTEPAIEEPEPIVILYPEPEFDAEYILRFSGENLEDTLHTIGNRAYLCTNVVSEALGINMDFKEEDLRWPAYQIQERFYISLADADRLFGVYAYFNDVGTVALYRGSTDFQISQSTAPEDAKAAYIRLEDIMADNGSNGRFTHENLEKLRMFGKFLQEASGGFYIAWIPKYVNPGEEVVNDISKDLSFYNTDFVYSMDVLVNCGGRIGLHGLTHQRGNQVSADGWEFDADAKLSAEQAGERMDEAIAIADAMGWKYYFFEFPHYGATGVAIAEANKRFDVVYQQSPYMKKKGIVDGHKMEDRTVWYVPTPADSVQSEYDGDAIIKRMKNADAQGKAQSIFFHPAMDYARFFASSTLTDRCFKAMDNSILRRICLYLDEAGERFMYFDFIEQ